MLPLLCTFCIKMWNAQLLATGSVLLQLHAGTVSSQAADRCTAENIVVLAGRVLCLMKQTTRIPLVHMYLCVFYFFCKFIAWFILLWFGDHMSFSSVLDFPSSGRKRDCMLFLVISGAFPSGAISHSSYTVYRPICRLHTHKTVTHQFTKGQFIVRSIFN